MVEILDETPALDDPLFLEIWEGINLKKACPHFKNQSKHSFSNSKKPTGNSQ
jgi:hypothetical protein